MTFIVDASFAHATITPAALQKIGAGGAILYAGCDDTRKNCTADELHALLAAGFMVELVIENGAQDMLGGAAAGDKLGRNLVAAAQALGYDWEHSALATAADWDVQLAEVAAVDAAMGAFGQHMPVPGLYSNRRALDYCTGTGRARQRWQSNSTSFSDGVSPYAQLVQRYNDPRAGALVADVNDTQLEPLGMMGETVILDPKDPSVATLVSVAEAIQAQLLKDGVAYGTLDVGDTIVAGVHTVDNIYNLLKQQTTAPAPVIDYQQLAAALAPLVAPAIAEHLAVTVGLAAQ